MQRDFYELKTLTAEDLFYLKILAVHKINDDISEESIKFNNIYELLFAIQNFQKNIKNSSLDGYINLLEKQKYIVLEDIHCEFERSGFPYLKLIIEDNISFFKVDKARVSCWYSTLERIE